MFWAARVTYSEQITVEHRTQNTERRTQNTEHRVTYWELIIMVGLVDLVVAGPTHFFCPPTFFAHPLVQELEARRAVRQNIASFSL